MLLAICRARIEGEVGMSAVLADTRRRSHLDRRWIEVGLPKALKLYSNNNEEFTGSTEYPLSVDMIDANNQLTFNQPSCTSFLIVSRKNLVGSFQRLETI